MKKLFLLIVIISSVVTAGVAQHRPHHRGHRPHHEKKENPVAPEFLKKGDKVAILSPSSVPTDLSIIDKGADVLRGWGFEVVEGRYARTNYHTYAGTPEQRVEDIMGAARPKHQGYSVLAWRLWLGQLPQPATSRHIEKIP